MACGCCLGLDGLLSSIWAPQAGHQGRLCFPGSGCCWAMTMEHFENDLLILLGCDCYMDTLNEVMMLLEVGNRRLNRPQCFRFPTMLPDT